MQFYWLVRKNIFLLVFVITSFKEEDRSNNDSFVSEQKYLRYDLYFKKLFLLNWNQ